MKIVEHSSDRLVVEDVPWVLGGGLIFFTLVSVYSVFHGLAEGHTALWVCSLIFAGGMVWVFYAMIQRMQLVLDRASNAATLTIRSARGLEQRRLSLTDLSHAITEIEKNDEGESYRTVLKLARGPERVALTPYYSGGRAPERVTHAINAWLDPDNLAR